MRILVAVHGFPPTHFAGAERAAERIVHWLVANGHEAEVFAIEAVDADAFRIESGFEHGFTVHRLYYDIKKGDFFHNLYDYIPVGEAFREVLAAKPFDLVHMVSGYMLAGQIIHTAKEAGIPVVVTLTEYWFMCARLNLLHPLGQLCNGPDSPELCARCLLQEERRFRLLANASPRLMNAAWPAISRMPFAVEKVQAIVDRRDTLQRALNSADLVISPSRFLTNKFAEYGYDTARYVHIRHGIQIKNAAPQAQTPRPDGRLRLGYIGQIKQHKAIDLLIDAVLPLFDDGHDFVLDIWGPASAGDAYASRLQQRTSRYQAIHWHGSYAAPQLWSILSSLDALVVPSRWFENSPTVITEAFAAGRPVIATDLGGMAELVEHETSGLLFELDNATDLRFQIKRLVLEPELLDKITAGVPQTKTADMEIEEIYEQYKRIVALGAESRGCIAR